MDEVVIKVKKIKSNVELPSYLYESDAGFDLRAIETVRLFPGEQREVKTGLILEIPDGVVGLIRDRVGIVTKMGIHTSAGTFDQGFRGEISVVLVNMSEETKYVEEGMRIAQMILIPVIKPKILEVKNLEDTQRGKNSFGSTGLKELNKLTKEMNSSDKKKLKKKKK
jgi:dUTP pyrophosphatase